MGSLSMVVDSLDGLPPEIADCYERSGRRYLLVLDDVEQHRTAGLVRKNAQLLGELAELRAAKQQADTPLGRFFTAAADRLAPLSGDERAAEMEKISQELEPVIAGELAAVDQRHQRLIVDRTEQIGRLMVEDAAGKLADKVARTECRSLLIPQIVSRLAAVQLEGSQEITVAVLDENRQPTRRSLESVADEMRTTPSLKPFLRDMSADEQVAHTNAVAKALGVNAPPTPAANVLSTR